MGCALTATLLPFVLGINVLAAQCQEQFPPGIVTQVDGYINELVANHSVASLGLAMIKIGNEGNGEKIYSKGYGFQDLENQVPSHNRTLFAVGSITKVRITSIITYD